MDTFLLAAPPAFAAGCRALSALADSDGTRASAVIKASSSSAAAAAASGAGDGAASDAARYALAAMQRSPAPAAALTKLLAAYTDLSDAAVRLLVAEFVSTAGSEAGADGGAAASTRAASDVGTPRLASVDWALGVATHASSAASVALPLVHLRLNTVGGGGSGGGDSVSVALTLPQLVAFESTVRAAAAALETA